MLPPGSLRTVCDLGCAERWNARRVPATVLGERRSTARQPGLGTLRVPPRFGHEHLQGGHAGQPTLCHDAEGEEPDELEETPDGTP